MKVVLTIKKGGEFVTLSEQLLLQKKNTGDGAGDVRALDSRTNFIDDPDSTVNFDIHGTATQTNSGSAVRLE